MSLSFVQTFLSTVVIMSAGTFVLVCCGAFVGYSLGSREGKTAVSQTNRHRLIAWLLLALLAVWLGVSLSLSVAGLISLQLVMLSTVVPVFVGWGASYLDPIKKILRGIPTHWFIFLQSYRVLGGLFIFPYLTEGVLTRGFALNAGLGDVLTGILAVPVAYLVMSGGRRWRGLFWGWTAFGILDLLVAMFFAGYFGFAAEGAAPAFPITLLPLFLGPPLSILMHLLTVRNFNLRLGQTSEDLQIKTAV